MMNLNRRQKILAGLLAACLFFSTAADAMNAWIFQPLEMKRKLVDRMNAEIADRELERLALMRAAGQFETGLELSLDQDTAIASTRYQQWIVQVTDSLGVDSVRVTPGLPIEEGAIGNRLPFTIQITGSVPALNSLLSRLNQLPILHSINAVSIVAEDPRDQSELISARISTELLTLEGAGKGRSLPRVQSSGEQVATDYDLSDLFFLPLPSGLPDIEAEQQKVTIEQSNPINTISLVAAFSSFGQSEAWFVDSDSEESYIVKSGEMLEVGQDRLQLVKVGNRDVILMINEERFRLELGDTLAKMVRIEIAAATSSNPKRTTSP